MVFIRNFRSIFFVLLATFLCSGAVQASQEAVVLVEKAIIYSDHTLKSPIGYLTRGKKVLVGEKKRNKGRVLPTVLNGRIVYIRVSDIQTTAQALDEENIQEKIKRKMLASNPQQFEFRYLQYSAQVSNPAEENSETETYSMRGGGIKGHILSNSSRQSYRLSMDFLEGTKDDGTFRMLNLDFELAFALIIAGKSRFNLYAGLSLSPHSQFKAGSLYTKNAYGYGALAGGELAIGITQRASVHINGAYHYKKLTGFNLPKEVDMELEPVFSGVMLTAGLSYSF